MTERVQTLKLSFYSVKSRLNVNFVKYYERGGIAQKSACSDMKCDGMFQYK